MRGCDCPPADCAAKVRRYLEGDRGAGDELVLKFTPLVRAIGRRVHGGGSHDACEEACQIAFLKVFAKLETWEQRCPFCDWLGVVATRRILDLTRNTRETINTVSLPAEVVDRAPASLTPETIERVERVVARWSPDWRKAYEMAIVGQDRLAIAQAMGKSVRTIQYWLAAIRQEIADCLDG